MLTWIPSLGVSLPLSIIYIVWGLISYVAKVPKNINYWAGYRTRLALKNPDTWRFANDYFGKGILYTGIISLVGSLVVLFMAMTSDSIAVQTGGFWVCFICIIIIFIPIILTESALRKKFDKNGERK